MAGVLGSPQTPDVGQELLLGIMTARPLSSLFLLLSGLFFLASGI